MCKLLSSLMSFVWISFTHWTVTRRAILYTISKILLFCAVNTWDSSSCQRYYCIPIKTFALQISFRSTWSHYLEVINTHAAQNFIEPVTPHQSWIEPCSTSITIIKFGRKVRARVGPSRDQRYYRATFCHMANLFRSQRFASACRCPGEELFEKSAPKVTIRIVSADGTGPVMAYKSFWKSCALRTFICALAARMASFQNWGQ